MNALDTPQSICQLGVARADVTPSQGIYHRMWGAAVHDRATGIHRPLTATAIALGPIAVGDDAPRRFVVAIDHCLFWGREMDALLTSVGAASKVPREQITIAFSHTHSAGLMGYERAELPGGELIGPYLTKLAQQIAGLLQQAECNMQSATIVYGQGRSNLAAHRDFWDAEHGQFVCGFNPTGPSDDTLLVARVTGDDGRRLASIVNYACHPTTLAWQNTLISPDYPGAMREVVEQATGAPCVFLQGASGDLGPREGFVGDVEVADRNGRQLGYAALSTLEGLPPPCTKFEYTGPMLSGATLGTWAQKPLTSEETSSLNTWRLRHWTLDLPYRRELPTVEATEAERRDWQAKEQQARAAGDVAAIQACRAMVERCNRRLTRIAVLPRGECFPLPISMWQMGRAIWLAIEGEHYQILQRQLRGRFPDVPIIVITLANGSRCSYLPERETYGKGIYQETIAVIAPGGLEQVIEAVGEQIESWLSR